MLKHNLHVSLGHYHDYRRVLVAFYVISVSISELKANTRWLDSFFLILSNDGYVI